MGLRSSGKSSSAIIIHCPGVPLQSHAKENFEAVSSRVCTTVVRLWPLAGKSGRNGKLVSAEIIRGGARRTGGGGYEKAIQYSKNWNRSYPFGTYAHRRRWKSPTLITAQDQAAGAGGRGAVHQAAPESSACRLHVLPARAGEFQRPGRPVQSSRRTRANATPRRRAKHSKPSSNWWNVFRTVSIAGFPGTHEVSGERVGQHEVHVARYYFRRGAYLAAVNRAQGVVKDYTDAPAIEEALFIMARCYDALGLSGAARRRPARVRRRTTRTAVS